MTSTIAYIAIAIAVLALLVALMKKTERYVYDTKLPLSSVEQASQQFRRSFVPPPEDFAYA